MHRSDNGIVNGSLLFFTKFGFPMSQTWGLITQRMSRRMQSQKRNDLSLSFRSGLKITCFQIRLNFDYSFSNSENLSNVRTGFYIKISVFTKRQPGSLSFVVTFIGADLKNFLSFRNICVSFRLAHNFSGKQSITWNEGPRQGGRKTKLPKISVLSHKSPSLLKTESPEIFSIQKLKASHNGCPTGQERQKTQIQV